MIKRSRELENALGSTIKKIEDNEKNLIWFKEGAFTLKKKKNEKIYGKGFDLFKTILKKLIPSF